MPRHQHNEALLTVFHTHQAHTIINRNIQVRMYTKMFKLWTL